MKNQKETKKRIRKKRIIDGEIIDDHGADLSFDRHGGIDISGLWSGVIPVSFEEVHRACMERGIGVKDFMSKVFSVITVSRMEDL